MNKETTEIKCPACGNVKRVEKAKLRNKNEFQCAGCETRFSITFDTGEDGMAVDYILAKDYP